MNLHSLRSFSLTVISFVALHGAQAALTVPAFTAYLDPDPNGMPVSKEKGISDWKNTDQHVLWFGQINTPGKLAATVTLIATKGSRLQLTINGQKHAAKVEAGVADFGSFDIASPGWVKFDLSILEGFAKTVTSLNLDGAAVAAAHFNLEPRRNAASVHLFYPTPKDARIALFYNEVTAIDDPVATYYMACGFSRGYFGMQVNSPTERRIIFSVWDSGKGQEAKDRSRVAEEDQTQLMAKGDGVEASVFGNEGTGGHSHLVYDWKTGQPQKFVVQAKAEGTHTTYSGWWFHPDKRAWMLIASFRAPKDGGLLRGLYSFSENFGGSNGHLRRKALFGPQWIASPEGEWTEITSATFSHDATGKAARLDRFMGVEDGKFFLSHGGFVDGFTSGGEAFHRPPTTRPTIDLPPR